MPVFPLNLVAFPGELLNLHIFEPRYIELIQDCLKESKTFGIPAVLDDHLAELGTEMEVLEVVSTYEDGKMDVRTRGVQVIRVLEFLREVPEKQYSAAIIDYRDDTSDYDREVSSLLFAFLRQFQQLLHIATPHFERPSDIKSYEIGHLVGLSAKEEYQLLLYEKETDRQKFLLNHLKQVIPVIVETERLKERIKLNGHFREEIPPKL